MLVHEFRTKLINNKTSITDEKLKAAIQIALGEHDIYTKKNKK